MIEKFFLLILFFISIGWGMPSLDKVLHYPPSYYRDYWLIQYLKRSSDPGLAEKIYKSITHKKPFHLKLVAKKNPKYKKVYECRNVNNRNWRRVSVKCILRNGFNFNYLRRMSNNEIVALLNYLPTSTIKKEISIVFNKNYKKAFKNPKIFYDIFLSIMPNVEIPKIYLNNLAKDRRFGRFLSVVVRKRNKNRLQKALLHLHYQEVKDEYKFDLALNAIRANRENLAIKILKSKRVKDNRDLFWLYLLSENRKYAEKLLNNRRLDFYTLYIYEQFNKKYVIDEVEVYNTTLPQYDINNPLDVIKFYRDRASCKDYLQFMDKLDNEKTLPLKALLLDKVYNYQKNFYIMPKYKLDDLTPSAKALFYAIARQESRFIPAQTSKSYAIGLMQLMPFLIRSFRPKESMEQFWRDEVNVKYAKKYLLWLISKLGNNPLFISYAYNGGLGFVQRKVIPYFKYKGNYEPFLSMEMIPYSETREYGKKVLTNYVVYMKLLDEKTSLHKLLKKLVYIDSSQ
jgi:soluble lytic murein transglycosylase